MSLSQSTNTQVIESLREGNSNNCTSEIIDRCMYIPIDIYVSSEIFAWLECHQNHNLLSEFTIKYLNSITVL